MSAILGPGPGGVLESWRVRGESRGRLGPGAVLGLWGRRGVLGCLEGRLEPSGAVWGCLGASALPLGGRHPRPLPKPSSPPMTCAPPPHHHTAFHPHSISHGLGGTRAWASDGAQVEMHRCHSIQDILTCSRCPSDIPDGRGDILQMSLGHLHKEPEMHLTFQNVSKHISKYI